MLNIEPKRTALFLAKIMMFLIFANCIAMVATYHFGDNYFGGFVPLFDLDQEKNLPTLFNTLLLLLCSGLLAVIYIGHTQRQEAARLWLVLAIVFLFMAVDEFVALHEHLNGPLRHLLHASGPFFFAWVIPYGILMLVLASAYGRFVLTLPAKPRSLVIIAFLVYVGGALGLEMVGGRYFELHHAEKTLTYGVMSTIEESMEMTGLFIFIYALMLYIEQVQRGFKLQLAHAVPPEPPHLVGAPIELVKVTQAAGRDKIKAL